MTPKPVARVFMRVPATGRRALSIEGHLTSSYDRCLFAKRVTHCSCNETDGSSHSRAAALPREYQQRCNVGIGIARYGCQSLRLGATLQKSG